MRQPFGNIDHVAIVVASMARTVRFYKEKFGFEVERSFGNPELGVKAVVLRRGRSRIELFSYSDRKAGFAKRTRLVHGIKVPRSYFEPGIRHIAFRSEGFSAAVEQLARRGLRPVVQPKTGYSGDRITFFRDPNGVLLELVSPLGRKRAPTEKRR